MSAHRPEVADVFREFRDDYLLKYGASPQQRKILRELPLCQTQALGGHKMQCDRCGHEQIVYNSCRNRHCPKCQAAARARWLEDRENDLLDVPYFHVVFTLPDELGPIALQNKRLLYGMLFKAASETLLEIAKDPKHLGAHIGFLAVLHTWGQNLQHHPHVHCVVPGGGLSPDGSRWISCRPHFFLPVRVLSARFRNRFLKLLKAAFENDKLVLQGKLACLAEAPHRTQLLESLRNRDWVVYAKPPFGGPQQVLKYLARYTHRVAIANQRLVSIDAGKVSFRWKDYRHANRKRIMTLDAVEFMRRFLLHALPGGFQRIRHFGFLANCVRREKVGLCRRLLNQDLDTLERDGARDDVDSASPATAADLCPKCEKGTMIVVETLKPVPLWLDSS